MSLKETEKRQIFHSSHLPERVALLRQRKQLAENSAATRWESLARVLSRECQHEVAGLDLEDYDGYLIVSPSALQPETMIIIKKSTSPLPTLSLLRRPLKVQNLLQTRPGFDISLGGPEEAGFWVPTQEPILASLSMAQAASFLHIKSPGTTVTIPLTNGNKIKIEGGEINCEPQGLFQEAFSAAHSPQMTIHLLPKRKFFPF